MIKLPVFLIMIFTSVFYFLFWLFPNLTEIFYGNLIFPVARLMLNTLIFLVPLPLFYVFILGVVAYAIYKGVVIFGKHSYGVKRKLIELSRTYLKGVLILICFFYWIWGFNYLRPSATQSLQLTLDPISKERVFDQLHAVTYQINVLRDSLYTLGFKNPESFYEPPFKGDKLMDPFNHFLDRHNFMRFNQVPLKLWYPEGFLLRNNTSGMYFPFTGECTIDPGIHPLQMPFTAAHEMGHGVGFTNEGFCNLLALVVCTSSNNLYFQYSGYLTYWRYLAREARTLDRERYSAFVDGKLNELIVEDLKAIYQQRDKFPEWFPQLQRQVYDGYLRAHGVPEGIASYSQVLMLADSYFKLYE